MRIARIATPDGVTFAALDGEHGSQVAAEILDHPMHPGRTVSVTVEGIGTLTNPVLRLVAATSPGNST